MVDTGRLPNQPGIARESSTKKGDPRPSRGLPGNRILLGAAISVALITGGFLLSIGEDAQPPTAQDSTLSNRDIVPAAGPTAADPIGDGTIAPDALEWGDAPSLELSPESVNTED